MGGWLVSRCCAQGSVSLCWFTRALFLKTREGKKKQRMSKECSGETRMRGNLYCRICALMLESDTWHRLSVCFWTSEHVSTALSSVGISSGVLRYSKIFSASQSLSMREGICLKCCGVLQREEHSFNTTYKGCTIFIRPIYYRTDNGEFCVIVYRPIMKLLADK